MMRQSFTVNSVCVSNVPLPCASKSIGSEVGSENVDIGGKNQVVTRS
jgi:hypothetical protein